ncbi:hypothetical protein RJ641_013755 [Dillenia turbinata]|uniref:E3 ubiquitin-protein ligase RMA n=1 Tax=Dillenia turbinata TaxID=194707 RepID=A0AAN8WE17_9MAGN
MTGGFEDSTIDPMNSTAFGGSTSNDVGDFECNICFELAQDPVVTLCGHLYCWPCLYRWLRVHSHSQECPVCKALIREEKLVPLYGRGKSSSDPRLRSIPGMEIPHRPYGQRPETAPAPDPNHFAPPAFGLAGGGFTPVATPGVGNFTLSAAVGGFVPSLFNLQVHGFHDATVYGTTSGFPHGFFSSFYGGHAHGFHHYATQRQESGSLLAMGLLVIGALVILGLLFYR